jgi:hypothetical protein
MRREILRSAGLDYCLLRELVHFSENVAPMLTEEQRASLAAESLRELFDQGLVFLFRSSSVHQMDEEAADETARLSAGDVHAALDAKDWAREPPGAQETVCFGLTPEGLAGLRTQEAEYDAERLEAWARREFDSLAAGQVTQSVDVGSASGDARDAGEICALSFTIGSSHIDVICTYYHGIDYLEAAWERATADIRSKRFDTRWRNDRDFVCGYAQLAERSAGGWQLAWTDHPGCILTVASGAAAEPLLDLFVNSSQTQEGKRILVGRDGFDQIAATSAPSAPSTMRVAAYVREPHASSLRGSAKKREKAIRQAGTYLASLGWTSLEYRHAEWDDDPQQGKAFYIHFLGVPPGGEPSQLTAALGAVDCIAFTPNL